jgi:hypothetical protein
MTSLEINLYLGILKKCSRKIDATPTMETLSCITNLCADINGSLSADKVNVFIRVCRETVPKDKDGRDNFFMEQYRNSVQNFTSVLTSDADDINEEQAIEALVVSTEDDLMQCLPCYDPDKQYTNSSLRTTSDFSESLLSYKAKSTSRFKHKFVLRNKMTKFADVDVCRTCWAGALGFSIWKLDAAALRMKQTNTDRPNPHNVVDYDDTTFHDYTYNDSMKMFNTLKVDHETGK